VLVVLSQRMGWLYMLKKYGSLVVIYAELVVDGGAGGEYELLPGPGVNTATGKPPSVALLLPEIETHYRVKMLDKYVPLSQSGRLVHIRRYPRV
jgi:hypothetical protein